MISVVSAGAAGRVAAPTFFCVERAGSGTAARYLFTVLGAAVRFAFEWRCGFCFFMGISTEMFGGQAKRDSRMGGLWLASGKLEVPSSVDGGSSVGNNGSTMPLKLSDKKLAVLG